MYSSVICITLKTESDGDDVDNYNDEEYDDEDYYDSDSDGRINDIKVNRKYRLKEGYDDHHYGYKPRKKKIYVPVFVPEKEKKKSKNLPFLISIHNSSISFVTLICLFSSQSIWL